MSAPPVYEPLRDVIGRAIYEEPGENLDWYSLSEEKREPWRKDADRVIAAIETNQVLMCQRISIIECQKRVAGAELAALGVKI